MEHWFLCAGLGCRVLHGPVSCVKYEVSRLEHARLQDLAWAGHVLASEAAKAQCYARADPSCVMWLNSF